MDTTDVLAVNEAFYVAFNDKSFGAMESLWSATDAISCVHPGWNLLTGREAVLDSWRRILANPEQLRVVSGGATATILGDVAVVACREFVSGTPLVVTNILVREAGAWRVLHHHAGPVLSP